MKTKGNTQLLLLALVFMACPLKIFAQVSVLGNSAGGTNFVGWDNTVAVPLRIEHKETYSASPLQNPSIEFYITGLKYMFIDGQSKNVAIGNAIAVNSSS